jgi:hypothetical protein
MIDAIGRIMAALLLSPPLSAPTDATLVVTAALADSTYCSTPDGNATLWVRIDVKYENTLGVPAILPMATRAAGYQLFRSDARGHPDGLVREFKSKLPAMFDPSKLSQAQPDPQLFEVLQPGGVAHRIEKLGLAVGGPRVARLPAGDYYLRVRVDQWPARRKWGQVLATSWATYGRLLSESIVLQPVRVRVQQGSPSEPCSMQVD